MAELKVNVMAKKYAKMKLNDIVPKEDKDSVLKGKISKELEAAYKEGFNLAVEECHKENSRSGEDMYYYLTELETEREGII